MSSSTFGEGTWADEDAGTLVARGVLEILKVRDRLVADLDAVFLTWAQG
jgi:hypothetical protein